MSASTIQQPKYAVAEYCLPDTTFEEDLVLTAASGATGISVLERKLSRGSLDAQVAALRASGLAPVTFSPEVISPLAAGGNQTGPADPESRIAAMCASIRRLSVFQPDSFLAFTGWDPARSPADNRSIAIEGLREAARAAAESGGWVSLEPIRKDLGITVSFVQTLPETVELVEAIGEPNVAIAYDIYHLWDTPDILADTARYAGLFRGVHVSDWRQETRSWMDRALPGDGIIDLPAIFAALEEGGYDGWYHLETPSDDGRYGNAFPDSLWALEPSEVLRRGRAGFEAAWEARHG